MDEKRPPYPSGSVEEALAGVGFAVRWIAWLAAGMFVLSFTLVAGEWAKTETEERKLVIGHVVGSELKEGYRKGRGPFRYWDTRVTYDTMRYNGPATCDFITSYAENNRPKIGDPVELMIPETGCGEAELKIHFQARKFDAFSEFGKVGVLLLISLVCFFAGNALKWRGY